MENKEIMNNSLDLQSQNQINIGDFKTGEIYNGDFIELAKKIPDQSIDLIIADPPYNSSKGSKISIEHGALLGSGGSWSKINQDWDDMPLDVYLKFTISWLKEAKRILKKTGSIWVHGTYHNIGIINFIMQTLEVEIINEVIWYKKNSFPNLSGRRLTASHETIIWAHSGKGKRDYYFNYEYSKNGDFSYDSLKSPEKQMRTVWDISNNKRKEELKHGKHPAQKPLRLSQRLIRISSKPNDICLVPFAGAGTECLAAKIEGLKFIGFEINKDYIKIANKRLNEQ